MSQTGSKKKTGVKTTKKLTELHKKYEATINKESFAKPVKDVRKITDLKNPRNVTLDEEKANEIGLTLQNTRDAFETTKRKRDDQQHLVPLRENQRKETLSIRANEKGAEEPSDIYRNMMLINSKLHQERNKKALPLEQLTKLGLLTTQKKTIDERQQSMATQLKENCDLMRDQLIQLTHNGENALSSSSSSIITLKREISSKKRRVSENQNSMNVKLSLMLGQQSRPFGYTRYASSDQKTYTFQIFDTEKDELRRAFFQSDPLEDETPYGSIPSKFNLFHQLMRDNRTKYESRNAAMSTASSLVPRTPLEYLNREQIKQKYRRRPQSNDVQCVNGTRCLFYTFTTDPDIRYVGCVFSQSLCYDCFLARLTLEVMDNISKERSQEFPINQFSVIVGEGEYSADCMLPVTFNNIITGIVGHVPRYDAKNRFVGTMVLRDLVKNTTFTETYIAETGMDF
jgi:hypothetical protein